MTKKILTIIFLLGLFSLISCGQSYGESTAQPKSYSSKFTVSGYYVCYDGVHYKYHCSSVSDVKEIIKYYYPDCFDVIVYNPGTEQTGYLNTHFYATWKSYLNKVTIR